MVACATQLWAEPAQNYPKTVAGLQALLDQYPNAITMEQKVVVEGKAPEWVASPETDCPNDLRISVGALSYYLNSADEHGRPYATIVDGRIVLNQQMSQFVFDDGFDQLTRDIQKVAVSSRKEQANQERSLGSLTKSYDLLLTQSSSIDTPTKVVGGAIIILIFGLIFLNHSEIKKAQRVRSGETLAECRTAIKADITKLQRESEARTIVSNQAIADSLKDGTLKSNTDVKEALRLLSNRMDRYDGIKIEDMPSIPGIGNKSDFIPDELPPKWEPDPKDLMPNGNGVPHPAPSPTPLLPPPNTEEEPAAIQAQSLDDELPLDPTVDLSILDKQAAVPTNGVQRMLAEMNGGDQGEPTRQTKRPKTISLEEPQSSSKEEQTVSVN